MRPKTPPFKPNETKEEREQKLRDFILAAIGERAIGRNDSVAVLARSPDSPVMRALLAVSGNLAACRAGASIILAGGALAAEDETWSLEFSANFVHQIRLTSNPRILDGHEQIVIGDSAAWYGDSMRRDPWKRDAFATFHANDPKSAHRARLTFGRLWDGAQCIYANPVLDTVIVSASKSSPVGPAPIAAEAEEESVEREPQPVAADAVCATVETLEAWQPSTRH